jgi:hypothetical protein
LLRSPVSYDRIFLSTPPFARALHLAASWCAPVLKAPAFHASYWKALVRSCTTQLFGSSPISRAPPANVVLFSA